MAIHPVADDYGKRKILHKISIQQIINLRQALFVGNYVARIELEYLYNEDSWSPCIPVEDSRKLDEIKAALENGDLKKAGLNAKIYTLTPVTKAALMRLRSSQRRKMVFGLGNFMSRQSQSSGTGLPACNHFYGSRYNSLRLFDPETIKFCLPGKNSPAVKSNSGSRGNA